MKKWGVLLVSVLVVLALAFVNRWWVLMSAMSVLGPPDLVEAEDEPDGMVRPASFGTALRARMTGSRQ